MRLINVKGVIVQHDPPCMAELVGDPIDPDRLGRGIGEITPSGEAVFQQRSPPPAFCHGRRDECRLGRVVPGSTCVWHRGMNINPRRLLQQLFLCDVDDLAAGQAIIEEHNGRRDLHPEPDFTPVSLRAVRGHEVHLCAALEGRYLRVRRSMSRNSSCNEEMVLEGVINATP